MPPVNALQLSVPTTGAPLNAQQKRFNSLLRQIDQARQALAAWIEGVTRYRQLHTQVVVPRQTELKTLQRRWAFALDELLKRGKWTKAERQTLVDLICSTASELLQDDPKDADLMALFDKHAEVDYQTEQKSLAQAMKDLTETMTGLDLGDIEGIETNDDLLARLEKEVAKKVAAEAELRSAKPTRARPTAAQRRREEEALKVTQSVRDVFRKLASALHPDRETDPVQREAKTALMQKVNQAYERNDLLTLLELQLEIEQIDTRHILNAGAERLRHFNKVLAEQLADLRSAVLDAEMRFCFEFGQEPGTVANPRQLDKLILREDAELQQVLSIQRRDLQTLGDVAATKRLLKHYRRMLAETEFDFPPF